MFMKYFIKLTFSFCTFIIISNLLFSQITVPINKKEMEQYNRERQAITTMNIDLSQTWLYMVKDNIISTNKVLLSEVFYSKQGLPELVVQYDENQNIVSNTKIRYNSRHLPFEEIKFSEDSSLISGIMYEYDENGFLKKQINYNENAIITSVQEYIRKQDSIIISVFDNQAKFAYGNILIFENHNGESFLKSMYKVDSNQNIIEKNLFDYNEIYALRRKTVYDENNMGNQKDFIYNEDGALVRTIVSSSEGSKISDTSFEYDDFGNLIRIIEYEEDSNTSKLFFINYLSLVKEDGEK